MVIGVGVLGSAAMTGEQQAIEVHEATEVNDVLVAAMARLIPQLSSSNPPPDVDARTSLTNTKWARQDGGVISTRFLTTLVWK